eukprot:CAMPEP_0171471916 /NCGR_PEP_ID=MMETSP0946-20130122/986_1 /TAXON_ID=109269 /ORGANISM="Vaucheria litorea, Strain CCMP2940" /LENGTH=358 /DNA_ID=CAMNT_0012001491 /DNA_START=18 /DNA_END=1095 /DNA_ORIENTATION=+
MASAEAPPFEMSQLTTARVFQGTSPVISMDFHHAGEMLAIAASDKTITLFNAVEGKKRKTLRCMKYGVGIVRFTHHEKSVLISSDNANGDHDIRYLSLYDNQFLKFFRGHGGKVTAIETNPSNETFLSSSEDRTVRLWSLSGNECLGILKFNTESVYPSVAYDPTGLVFIANVSLGDENILRMYDSSKYREGPFNTAKISARNISAFLMTKFPFMEQEKIQQWSNACWINLKFSANENFILVSTNSSIIIMLDAFNGNITQVFRGHVNDKKSKMEASFSADGKFILNGSEDSKIYVWNAESGELVAKLQGHVGIVGTSYAALGSGSWRLHAATSCCGWKNPDTIHRSLKAAIFRGVTM